MLLDVFFNVGFLGVGGGGEVVVIGTGGDAAGDDFKGIALCYAVLYAHAHLKDEGGHVVGLVVAGKAEVGQLCLPIFSESCLL